MKKSNSPHSPRPTGKDAAKAEYMVKDTNDVVFGENLTYDQAWKRKEEVAGQRRSTTPRIVKQDATAVAAPAVKAAGGPARARPALRPVPSQPTYSEEARVAAAEHAARAASVAAAQAAADVAAEHDASIADALDATPMFAYPVALGDVSDDELADLLGDGEDPIEAAEQAAEQAAELDVAAER